MKTFLSIILIFSISKAVYLSNSSCKECHKEIYKEYQYSYHSKGYFNDILHRKIADKISKKSYGCASCHLPASKNLEALIDGKERPNRKNVEESDAISCFYCHEIAYVKKAHRHNKNILTRQIEGYKPSLYGNLEKPDKSDKHSSLKNPIYSKVVCNGCHSHKRNSNGLLIFKAMEDNQTSEKCIECHMPYINGGNENMNKRARKKHRSHYFYGIHNDEIRKKAIELKLNIKNNYHIITTLKNRMGHPLIIQPAREMFLKVEVKRGREKIWDNSSDKNATFKYQFLEGDKRVIIPNRATSYEWFNNLEANSSRVYDYQIKNLQRGDKIIASFYIVIAKKECLDYIGLKNSELDKPLLVKSVEKIFK